MSRRRIPEVNASSMADIAFLLLIFFLVATTMNADYGIQRNLAPMPEASAQMPLEVKKRNFALVSVNKNDQIMFGDRVIELSQLEELVREFYINPADNKNMSEKEGQKLDLVGHVPVSMCVISLQTDAATSYERYVEVQNELSKAFNRMREDFAQKHFMRPLGALTKRQRAVVARAVPMRISEAELYSDAAPRNSGTNAERR